MKSLLAAVAVLLCAQVLSGQAITLKPNIETGMSWTFDTTQEMNSNNKATFGGQTQPFNSRQVVKRSGTVEVLAVKDGEPSKVRVSYDDKCETSGEMGGQKQSMPFPLAGKSVTLTRAENGNVTSDLDNQLDPMVIAEAAGMIESEAVFFPNKPVAVGDEWPADAKGLSRLLQLQGPQDSAGATMKLLSVKNDPKPTAEVKVSMAVDRTIGGMNVKVVSQGTALVDLASGHITKLDSQGTTTSKGTMNEQTPDGQMVSFQVEGSGTLATRTTSAIKGGSSAAPPPAAGPVAQPGPAGNNPLAGGNPLAKKSFAGTFSDGKLTLDLSAADGGYSGSITLGETKFPATAAATAAGLAGTFTAGNDKYSFTATLDGDTVTLVSDGTTYTLKKQAPKNPLAR